MSNTVGWGKGSLNNSIGWGQGGFEYAETIVNISSAQILAMGTTPIELLPAAGANKYYDIDKVVVEYTSGASAYNFTDEIVLQINSNAVVLKNLLGLTDTWFIVNDLNSYELTASAPIGGDVKVAYGEAVNKGLTINTYNGTDPTDGDGTLRVKIYYKTITFGA